MLVANEYFSLRVQVIALNGTECGIICKQIPCKYKLTLIILNQFIFSSNDCITDIEVVVWWKLEMISSIIKIHDPSKPNVSIYRNTNWIMFGVRGQSSLNLLFISMCFFKILIMIVIIIDHNLDKIRLESTMGLQVTIFC